MNKNTKIAIAASCAGTLFAAWQYFDLLCSEVALMERFPDIDSKIVIKASRKMMFASLTGEYDDVDTTDESVMDEIFLNTVKTIQK